MKRFIAAIMVCLLICPAFAAVKAEGVEPVFYVEAPAEAGVGDTVSIRVGVSGDFVANILNLQMEYDSASFEYVSHTRGPVLDAASLYGMSICEHSEENHLISVGVLISGDEGFSAQGVIYEATFKVRSTASSNPVFKLNVAEFDYMPISQTVGTPINCTAENASIRISGTGSGAQVTPAAPIHTPTVPQPTPGSTASADTTPIPETSAKPADTQAAQTPGIEPGSVDNTSEPSPTENDVPEAVETEAAESDGKTDDNSGSKSNTEENKPDTLTTILVIAGGCVLAAGLAALGVFFIKRGKAAGEEARGKKE